MAIFTYNYKIKYSDIGTDNKITLKALVDTLQQAAISHSDSAGYGVNNIPNTHLAWLLLNWKVEIKSYPILNDSITIKTWPKIFDKLYSYRDFEVYDENNNIIAIASSKWFAIDTETKKIRKLTSEITDAYGGITEKNVFETTFSEKITIPEELKLNFNYKIQRRDLDTNKHVNNLHYIDYALETLPENIFETTTFNNLEILYKKEIKYNEKINCYYSFENNKHIITIKNNDNSIVHAIIKLY